jgi:hypothetical protein
LFVFLCYFILIFKKKKKTLFSSFVGYLHARGCK